MAIVITQQCWLVNTEGETIHSEFRDIISPPLSIMICGSKFHRQCYEMYTCLWLCSKSCFCGTAVNLLNKKSCTNYILYWHGKQSTRWHT